VGKLTICTEVQFRDSNEMTQNACGRLLAKTLVKWRRKGPNLQSRLVTVGIVEAPRTQTGLLAMKGNSPLSQRRAALPRFPPALAVLSCIPGS